MGFEQDLTVSESDPVVEICIKFFNSPLTGSATDVTRYEIEVEYESFDGSAGTHNALWCV